MTTTPSAQSWTLELQAGATYTTQVALLDENGDPITGFSTAEWRLKITVPGATEAFYTSDDADWTVVDSSTRTLLIPAETTADFPSGNVQFSFDVLLADSVTIYRLVAGANGTVEAAIE
jgi:hypothetical protein